jgi:phosphatidylglycerol:prolipoprotein diacylglycerol transferase
MLLAALAGSKILMLWTEPEYRENPLRLLSLDFLRSGGVFYGGFIGAVLTGYFLIKRYGLPWWKTADAFAPGIALGQAIGRQGCFAAGCCWGKATTAPWGVQFTKAGHEVTGVPIDVHLHPTQLYESFATLGIFFLLYWMHKRKRFDGQVILVYAMLYSLTRFTIEFFRDDPRGDILGITTLSGLSTSQLISLIVGIGSMIILIIRWKRATNGGAKNITTAAGVASA